jgi:glutamyl-tRNA synthetase
VALPDWRAPDIHAAIMAVAAEKAVGLGKVAQPIRVAVSGGTVSPPIDVTLEILGRETTRARLERAIAHCQ